VVKIIRASIYFFNEIDDTIFLRNGREVYRDIPPILIQYYVFWKEQRGAMLNFFEADLRLLQRKHH
jgi:hypothetical protein